MYELRQRVKDLDGQLQKKTQDVEVLIRERTEIENTLRKLGGEWDGRDKDHRKSTDTYATKVSS